MTTITELRVSELRAARGSAAAPPRALFGWRYPVFLDYDTLMMSKKTYTSVESTTLIFKWSLTSRTPRTLAFKLHMHFPQSGSCLHCTAASARTKTALKNNQSHNRCNEAELRAVRHDRPSLAVLAIRLPPILHAALAHKQQPRSRCLTTGLHTNKRLSVAAYL